MPPIFPDQASTVAGRVDALFFFLLAFSALIALAIGGLIVYFGIKFRRRAPHEVPPPIEGSTKLEVAWTVVPLGLAMGVFFWGAGLYLDMSRPPDDALEVYVIGRQWMWKFVHTTGQEEINELHVPVGRNVKLTMTSQDVIHSFFVPAFRVKADVLPERYTTTWFQATKPGSYHMFCAEYCGTDHAVMTGWVVALPPAEFQAWLGGPTEGPAAQGFALFRTLGCATCHHADGTGLGPSLVGVFGKRVQLQSGEVATADENYVRESILNPNAKVVAGYQPIMPTFQGRVSEEDLFQLLLYIKSLSSDATPSATRAP